jgi:peptidoglycan lytic transglycosylase
MYEPAVCAAILVLSISLAGCGHKNTRAQVPPPPAIPQPTPEAGPVHRPESEPKPEKEDKNALSIPADAKPILIETGLASWYGPPYHNRRGSNGEVYDMNAMTAAHRTLPLGSIVRVTNVKTGSSALVRITDRGPFIGTRIIDLSLAAAKKTDLVRAGVSQVRLEVLQTPAPIDQGGRWAVQIGAFAQEEPATQLADRISRRYHSAKVLHFGSPVGDWWVRVRVLGDDRQRAQELARDTKTPEGAVFLVRLD